MNKLRIKSLLIAMAALVAFAVGIAGQITGGAVTGVVTDPNGAVVSGATVKLTDKTRGLEFTTETTSAGSYEFPNVQTGTYTMTVTGGGFAEANGTVVVSLNQKSTANIALKVSGGTAVVNITGDSETIVQTDTSQVGATFTEKQFQNLPVGQNANNLALLAPNVTAPPIGVSGAGAITGGLRQRANAFTIDGVDNNDNGVSGNIRGVIPDSVSEFTFLQNNFNAEFSSGGAGAFNQITKSGTNNFHGSGYGYFGSERFNARSTNEDGGIKNRSRSPSWGGTFGGPILKDRLFFFANYQKDHFDGVGSTSGQFLTFTQAGLNTIAARPGTSPFVISLLQTGLPLAPTSAFVNCVNPAAPAPGEFGPIMGACGIGMNFVDIPFPNAFNTQNFQQNVDYNLNSKNQFRFRFYYTKFASANGVIAPAFASDTTQKQTTFSANWISTFSSNIINDFRFGYIKSDTGFNQLHDPAQFDFPILDLDQLGLAVGPADQQTDTKKTFQYYDSITWIAGEHAFKFGGEFLQRPNAIFFLPRHSGEYEYDNLDILFRDLKVESGLFNHKGIGDPIQDLASTQWGGFFQDDWKIRHNVTLNLGVRWDYQSIYEVEKLQALSAPGNVGPVQFTVPKADKNNFAPRVGFAWAPHFENTVGRFLFGKNDGDSSIRANFARSFFIAFSNLVSAGPPAALQGELVDQGPATAFLQSGGPASGAYVFNNSAANIQAVTGSLILDHVSPYADAFAVSYERQLNKSTGLEIRFLRTNGRSLFVQVQSNSRTVADDAMKVPTLYALPDAATLNALPTIGTIAAASTVLLGATQAPRQVPQFAGVLTSDPPVGKSRYNGLSFQLKRRFANHFSGSAAYTWSSTWDNAFNELYTSDLNPRRSQDVGEYLVGSGIDLSHDWSPSIADIPHRFVASGAYEVPFKSANPFLNALVGGWEVTGIFQAQSGQRVDIQSGVDSNRNGDGAGDRAIINPNGDLTKGSGVVALRLVAGVVTPFALGGAPNTNTRAYLPAVCNSPDPVTGQCLSITTNFNAGWVQTGFFAKELANGGAGTATRNAFRTNSFNNTDMVLIKNTKFGKEGRFNLQIAAEAHNVFNQRLHTIAGVGSGGRSFVLPQSVFFLNYGLGTYSGRTIQLRTKFIF